MVRTRLECPQVWQALFTTLSWFQLIKCSQQSWEGGKPSVPVKLLPKFNFQET